MGVEFDDLHPLRHRWRAVERITGGTSKKLTRKPRDSLRRVWRSQARSPST